MIARVLVADPSPCLRLSVRCALIAQTGFSVSEVATAQDALQKVRSQQPDVVLLDWALDPLLIHASQIVALLGGGALILLSDDESPATGLAAVRAGACGLLPKSTPPARLPAVIRGVLAGEAAFPRPLVGALLSRLRQGGVSNLDDATSGLTRLTPREREVLDLLAGGYRDDRVAALLGVSPVTVRRHVGAAKRKLLADGRSQAVAAYRRALV